MVSLSEGVSRIIGSRSQELYLLLQFVKDFDIYIRHRRTQDMVPDIPNNIETQFEEYVGEFVEFFEGVVSEVIGHTPIKGERTWEFKPQKKYPKEVVEYMIPFLLAFHKRIRYPEFLYNMALTHTIAFFESFLNDFLVAIFTLRPNTLKSENTATYEEILSFSSREKLIGHLASNRAEKILDGGPYEVVKNLNEIFSIDISKFDKFNTIHEAFCRRHIIVHNDSVTDKEYCNKIPNSQRGKRLSTDLQYIETLLTTMGEFIDYLDDRFSRKMRYRRNPRANQLVNLPDRVED